MEKFKYSNQKFAFAVTGGGSLFISNVLCEGGASNYLVSAVIPYDTKSLDKFVGGVREKFCSCSTARQMAVAAEKSAFDIGISAIGVGATCSLSKGVDERAGRVHNIYVAATFKEHCVAVEWTHRDQKYSRQEEETIAASLIKEVAERFGKYISDATHLVSSDLEAIFKGIGAAKVWSEIKVNIPSTAAKEKVASLTTYKVPIAFYDAEIFERFHKPKEKICIYSGSWNPIHADHERNFRICEKIYGAGNCFMEISLNNFEKPRLDSLELTRRLKNMRAVTKNIIVTDECSFVNKTKQIKNALSGAETKIVFAVGHDTFERIEELGDICSFLVFPRNGKKASPVDFSGNVIEKESYTLTEGQNLASSYLRRQ